MKMANMKIGTRLRCAFALLTLLLALPQALLLLALLWLLWPGARPCCQNCCLQPYAIELRYYPLRVTAVLRYLLLCRLI